MKKTIILASVLALISVGSAKGQSFLDKVKQKAENAVNQKFNNATGNNSYSSNGKMDISENANNENIQITTSQVKDYSYEPKEVSYISFGMDYTTVKPASGNTYEQLLAQLPSLPSASQIANPSELEYQTYLKKLYAVRLKAEQIIEETCQGAYVEEFNMPNIPQQTNANPLANLTEQEIQLLMKEGDQIEKEVMQQEKKLGRKMSDVEQFNFMRKNHKEFTKVALKMNEAQNGVSAVEMEKLLNDIDTEAKAKGRDLTLDEMDQIAKQKYPSVYNKAMAAKNKANQMEQAANQQKAKLDAQRENQEKILELENKLKRNKESAQNQCYQFAAKYEEDLRDIYQQIINTNDNAKISSLYSQADVMVADYRKNAANSWVSGISSHINLIKNSIGQLVTLHNLKDECSINHIKVNQLLNIIDDMEDAYGEFPLIGVEPVMVSNTNLKCYRSESVFYPIVTGFAENSQLSRGGENKTYKYSCEKVKPAYGIYKSADGKRVVKFDKDGTLLLPGGYVHYPIAFEQQGNTLVWYEMSFNGLATIQEYRYKL